MKRQADTLTRAQHDELVRMVVNHWRSRCADLERKITALEAEPKREAVGLVEQMSLCPHPMPAADRSDGIAILDSITGKDPKMLAMVQEETAKLNVARAVYELQKVAMLSTATLAKRLGTTAAVISRLEESDY